MVEIENAIAAGATVKFKLDGPKMKVRRVYKSQEGEWMAVCVWFTNTDEFKEGHFEFDFLDKVDD